MKEIKNTAVLAAVTSYVAPKKDKKDKNDFVILVSTLIDENGTFELPCFTIDGECDLKQKLLDSFYHIIEIDNGVIITPEQLITVGSYSVEHDDYLEVINAFMVFIDGKPAIKPRGGYTPPLWMNIERLEQEPLYGGHNEIVNDIRKRLLEVSLLPSSESVAGEKTKQSIITKYFEKEKDMICPWVNRLQSCGIHIHEYLHPGVAIDLVIFGYKKAEKGRRDELSVLLTYREAKEKDHWEGWSLPGTFLLEKTVEDPNGNRYPGLETVREAAVRIAKEKTGIQISPEDVLYEIKPFVHHSRMGGELRDGSPVITLPVFVPIEYSDVNGSLSTLTTRECKWFPIKRRLWSVNKEVPGGVKKIALRGGEDGPQKLNKDGSITTISDVTDDITAIETWKNDDFGNDGLLSPEEIGLPAADAYLRDEQLLIDYYQTVIRPHKPIQDRYYDKEFCKMTSEDGIQLMIADHANIIISALQEIAGNTRRTLHIVSKLLSGGTFAPAEIKRMLETWFFPWAFSRSNMQKKLRDTNKLIKEVADEKAGEGKSRSWSYKFVDADEIDRCLLDSKPF